MRLRYTKRGKVRWICTATSPGRSSARSASTELPLAFTEGFSPRPKVSFGLALSTGHESDAEYLDLVFAATVDLDALPARLTAALPEGIDVTGVGPRWRSGRRRCKKSVTRGRVAGRGRTR